MGFTNTTRRPMVALLLSLVLLLPASANQTLTASDPVTVTGLAVAQTGTGAFVGLASELQATVIANGTGQVFVHTKPLAQLDMQGSARLASRVAASTLGQDWRDFDFLVVFESGTNVIGGPSAGAVMTLAMTAALHNLLEPEAPWTLNPHVAATGTINPDGTIGPVGGVPEKAEGAARAGIQLFLYPAGLEITTARRESTYGTQAVQVEMASHCQSLGITCRTATTIQELVEAAAGVRLEQPAVIVPGTVDYAELIGPSVNEQVDDLGRRLAQLEIDISSVDESQRPTIQEIITTAEQRFQRATDAVSGQEYYTAATMTFQGAISAGHAEFLIELLAATNSREMTQAAVDECRAAVDSVQGAVYGKDADRFNHLYSLGAAQRRAHDAQDLLEQADGHLANAFGVQGLASALHASSFCIERTKTVTWWNGLGTTFGGGAAIEDPESLMQDVMTRAQDMVTYAQAVLGAGFAEPAAMTEAREHEDAGRIPAAILAASEAHAAANVAMQAVNNNNIPESVRQAALDGAARAVVQARAAGVEPMLSVSMMELSTTLDPVPALENLWNARDLALLSSPGGGNAPTESRTGFASGLRPMYSEETVSTAFVIGALIGGMVVAILAAGLFARKTRQRQVVVPGGHAATGHAPPLRTTRAPAPRAPVAPPAPAPTGPRTPPARPAAPPQPPRTQMAPRTPAPSARRPAAPPSPRAPAPPARRPASPPAPRAPAPPTSPGGPRRDAPPSTPATKPKDADPRAWPPVDRNKP